MAPKRKKKKKLEVLPRTGMLPKVQKKQKKKRKSAVEREDRSHLAVS